MTKKEIIKKTVDMMRMKERKIIAMILTNEEEKMSKCELKTYLINKEVRRNNKRLDEILKINEIS